MFLSSTAVAFLPAKDHVSHLWQHSKTTLPSAQILSTKKTHDEELFIKQVLVENSLFRDIPDGSFATLVDSLERQTKQRGEVIINQGDSCIDGYVYLIAEGSCRVLVDNVTVPEPYGTLGQNAVFGEMGILYDEKRAATVMVESESLVYYQIAGDLFKAAFSASRSSQMVSLEKMQEIDDVINTVSGTYTLYEGMVIPAYQPGRIWLWQQYAGTVFKISATTILLAMIGSAFFVLFARSITNEPFIWESGFLPPDKENPLVKGLLSEVRAIWDIQKTLTTFVLTFFVNQSFLFWGSVYKSVREVQGKLSGFNLLCVTNVKRSADGSLTAEAESLLEDVGQCARLFHVLFWASKAKRFSVLMSDEGLKRMESRGLMSTKQLDILLKLDLPNDKLFYAPLEWMLVRCNQAADEGVLLADNATKSSILREYIFLRNAFADIGNMIEGR